MPFVEDLPPNARVSWPTAPQVVYFTTSRVSLNGAPGLGRSGVAIKVAQHHGIAGVRFVLGDGTVDHAIVAVVPGQPCNVAR